MAAIVLLISDVKPTTNTAHNCWQFENKNIEFHHCLVSWLFSFKETILQCIVPTRLLPQNISNTNDHHNISIQSSKFVLDCCTDFQHGGLPINHFQQHFPQLLG